jgi:hypothetical protein
MDLQSGDLSGNSATHWSKFIGREAFTSGMRPAAEIVHRERFAIMPM